MKWWLLISCGEPFGIGYELTLKLFKFARNYKSFLPVVIGNKKFLEYTANKCQINFKPIVLSENFVHNISSISLPEGSLLLIDVEHKSGTRFSVRCSGEVSFRTLEKLVYIIKNFLGQNKNFAVLTMPVSKANIAKFYPDFVGHTEYFAEKFNIAKDNVSMLMEGKDENGNVYKVLMLTRHLPLKEVSKNLTFGTVVNQVSNVVRFIDKYEKIKVGKILICNLNPHGGEEGHLGEEEKMILNKSVKTIQRLTKKEVIFPVQTADAFFYAKNRRDVLIVTTYHDQAMIPLKLLCRYNIVNITIGLPFFRLSPGHGVATDIYLQNKADISSVKFCLDKLEEFVSYVKN